MNPANSRGELPDGTMAVTFGERDVNRTLVHHKGCQNTIFTYSVAAEGTFREVIESIPNVSPGTPQEAAMAYYVGFSRNFVMNSREGQKFGDSFRSLPNGLDNPFYAGVCEAILTRFKELGWI